ncbi:MAG: hypothetical protein PF486_09360 [Prolixibacteraceae bacterium]|nr:hypothetical protein [Prolixibacteraceae bacterium]
MQIYRKDIYLHKIKDKYYLSVCFFDALKLKGSCCFLHSAWCFDGVLGFGGACSDGCYVLILFKIPKQGRSVSAGGVCHFVIVGFAQKK